MKFKFDINSSDPCGIIGKVFGKLTVISYEGHSRDNTPRHRWQYWYKVRCSCRAHTEFTTSYNELSTGNTTGCKRCKMGPPIIPGDIFGHLTVKEVLLPDKDHHESRYVCICDCPKHAEIITDSGHLKSGDTQTCGDSWHYIKKEYTGKLKLGMIPNTEVEVLEICETRRTKHGERIAICKCHHVNPLSGKMCGKIFEATVSNLITGNTKSCGCTHNLYTDDKTRALGKKWFAMNYRCNIPTSKSYADYGGRGIKITPDWDETLEGRVAFIKDGIKKGFVLGQSIDRIDNDSGYRSDNVRFTDQVQQNNNKRNNHCIEAKGMKFTVAEWASKLHVNYVLLVNHLRCVVDESEYIRRLIEHELKITDRVPYELCKKRTHTSGYFTSKDYLTIDGETKLYPQWEQYFGVRTGFINTSLRRGQTMEQVIALMRKWKECGGNPHFKKSDRIYTVDGISLNIHNWSKKLNIPDTLLRSKVHNGSTDDVIEFIHEKLHC